MGVVVVLHRPTSRVGTRRRVWNDMGVLAAALGGMAAGAALWSRAGLVVNHSGSMPVGVYRVVRLTANEREAVIAGRLVPPRGAVVVWCLPADVAAFARRRGYVLPGSCPGGIEPVLKHIAALPGDTVVVDASGLRVNGRMIANSRALARDANGRPVAAVRLGRFVVQAGTAWLWSPYSWRSYDSRYFGAVPLNGWVGVSRALWVGGTELGVARTVSRNSSQ